MATKHESSDKELNGSEVKPTISPETWMSSLPSGLHHLPLTKLTIPALAALDQHWDHTGVEDSEFYAGAEGSHNSGTFALSTTLAPDADSVIAFFTKLPLMGSFVDGVINRWAKCQNLNFSQQLRSGIRYFDLRVSSKTGSDEFFLVHTVYAAKVCELIEAVKSFLECHPHELVMLDFNHFYAMEEEHHMQLITYLIAEFGHTICLRCDAEDLTLSTLWEKGNQVIIFYQHKIAEPFQEMWSDQDIYSFWPRTDNPRTCIAYLEEYFNSEHPEPCRKGFIVCQGVLTPVMENICSSATGLETLCKKLLPEFSCWIGKSVHFVKPLNIVVADFVDNEGLILKIIELNYQQVL